jgi:hypothetical protein
MGKPRFRPVFTPIGAALLVIALVILARSLYARNSYEMLISCVILLIMLILGLAGWRRAKKLALLEPGWKPPFPMTANSGEESLITGLGSSLPLFFRLHFIVRGKFSPNSDSICPMFAETSVSRGEETARLELDFPMSGIFHGSGYCKLRDIFGLFSFPCGITLQRTINVRSAPCFGKKTQINAQSGAEDRKTKSSTNEERFYMREYTPGDRLRDINWKSSEKIDALITRISPDNQEKVSRIEIYFRNFGPEMPSLEALWLLDRAKARLSYFLRSLMDENTSFVFSIRAAQGDWEIEDSEDLEDFLEALAGLSFLPAKNEGIVSAGTGDMYVFSTACDKGLSGFLLASHPRPISLFIVQPKRQIVNKELKKTGDKNKKNARPEYETLYKRNFPAKGCALLPRWFSKTRINPMNVDAHRIERIYAETKL